MFTQKQLQAVKRFEEEHNVTVEHVVKPDSPYYASLSGLVGVVTAPSPPFAPGTLFVVRRDKPPLTLNEAVQLVKDALPLNVQVNMAETGYVPEHYAKNECDWLTALVESWPYETREEFAVMLGCDTPDNTDCMVQALLRRAARWLNSDYFFENSSYTDEERYLMSHGYSPSDCAVVSDECLCVDDEAQPITDEEGLGLFGEGACVVPAHAVFAEALKEGTDDNND